MLCPLEINSTRARGRSCSQTQQFSILSYVLPASQQSNCVFSQVIGTRVLKTCTPFFNPACLTHFREFCPNSAFVSLVIELVPLVLHIVLPERMQGDPDSPCVRVYGFKVTHKRKGVRREEKNNYIQHLLFMLFICYPSNTFLS